MKEKKIVYFHSEFGKRSLNGEGVYLNSSNLIDFFIEVCCEVQQATIVIPCATGKTSVFLGVPGNTEIVEIPFPSNKNIKSLLKIWGMFAVLFSVRLRRTICRTDCCVSTGLSFFGVLVGVLRVVIGRKPHCFIVRGDRIKTARMSSRSLMSKTLLLSRLYFYRFIIDVLVKCQLAEVWFQGEMARELFRKRLGKSAGKSLHVLNAVLRNIGDGNKCQNEPVVYDVVFVGHLHLEKGVLDLVDAIDILRARGFFIRAQMIGAGVDEKVVKEYVLGKGLDSQFDFVGYIPNAEDLACRIKMSRLFVLPSHTEGVPRAMVEAMSLGIPVIVSRVGGVPYIIKEDHNGWLVDSGNPEMLANRIKESLFEMKNGNICDVVSNAKKTASEMSFKKRSVFFINNACN